MGRPVIPPLKMLARRLFVPPSAFPRIHPDFFVRDLPPRSAHNCNGGNLEQARMMAESQPQMAGGTVESRDERHLFPMLGATTIVLLIAACKLVVHLYAGHR